MVEKGQTPSATHVQLQITPFLIYGLWNCTINPNDPVRISSKDTEKHANDHFLNESETLQSKYQNLKTYSTWE